MYVVCEFDQRLPMVVLLWCRFVLTGVSAVSLLAHDRAEVHDLANGRMATDDFQQPDGRVFLKVPINDYLYFMFVL